MVRGKVTEQFKEDIVLNADNILNKITAFDIYKFYTPFSFKLGRDYSSPLRPDKNPSFAIKQSKTTGQIYHLDYAHPEHPYSGNCFQYLQGLYRCDYNTALQHINTDFQLGLGGQLLLPNPKYKEITKGYEQPEKATQYKRIDVFTRKMTKEELAYWAERFITEEELKKNYIFGFDKLLLDGQRITNPNHLLRFAYYFPMEDKWKIYSPNADKKKGEYKWISNLAIDIVENLNCFKNKSKIGIIGKSRKDKILLSKFIEQVGSAQNESEVSICESDIIYCKNNCSQLYISFDSDITGKKMNKYYTDKYNIKHLNTPDNLLPNIKDWDGLVINQGLLSMENFLLEKGIISK